MILLLRRNSNCRKQKPVKPQRGRGVSSLGVKLHGVSFPEVEKMNGDRKQLIISSRNLKHVT